MADSNSFTEVTTTGIGGNIGNSIGKSIAGIVVVLCCIGGLFWNEGNYVKTLKAYNEAGERLRTPDAQGPIDLANQGEVVYLSADAQSDETLTDPVFKLSVPSISLRRDVQFYQWEEEEESKTEDVGGGKSETTTTYHYKKVWVDEPIDSSQFKRREHQNTIAMPDCKPEQFSATKVTLGFAYELSPAQVKMMDHVTPCDLVDFKLPFLLRSKGEVRGNTLYLSTSNTAGSEPQIGDMKISWTKVSPKERVSLIAQLDEPSFRPFMASSGREVFFLKCGSWTSDELFADAHGSNSIQLWAIRIVGFIFMVVGLCLMAAPLQMLGNLLPFVGGYLSKGIGFFIVIVAFVLAIPLTFVTIAVAWLFYRPLMAIFLLLIAAGVIYLMCRAGRKKKLTAE